MKLEELMKNEGERFSSKIRELDSVEAFMAYLAEMGGRAGEGTYGQKQEGEGPV